MAPLDDRPDSNVAGGTDSAEPTAPRQDTSARNSPDREAPPRASGMDLVLGSTTYRWVCRAWVLYWLALFAVMHTKQVGVPKWMPQGSDKTLHYACYFVLGWLGWWVLSAPGRNRPWRAEHWLGLVAVYAASDEVLQAVCNRFCSTGDFVADIVGAMTAVAAIEILRAILPRPAGVAV